MTTKGNDPSKDLSLLTLKGEITIHFVDGDTLEAEFMAQDEFNVFVRVDDDPLMVPRSQIRYIKGKPSQKIEPDDSEPLTSTQETASSIDDTLDDDTTVPLPDEDDEEFIDELTMILPQDSSVDEIDAISDMLEDDEDTFVDLLPETSTDDDDEDPTIVLAPETQGKPADTVDKLALEKDKPVEITAHVDCTSGPHAGEVFKLPMGMMTIGRASDNIISLFNDKEISRKHSKITYEAGNFIIEDQNSLNGTFVNNQRLEGPRYLEDGDVIFIGVSTLEYHQS